MMNKLQWIMMAMAGALTGATPAFAAEYGSSVHVNSNTQQLIGPVKVAPAGNVQSTGSSVSASSSASSSVTVDGKKGKCSAEASANAKANGVEESDHDQKVVEGDGCSAKASSSATVKSPPPAQSE
jgi:hypothetical protein